MMDCISRMGIRAMILGTLAPKAGSPNRAKSCTCCAAAAQRGGRGGRGDDGQAPPWHEDLGLLL